MGDSSEHRSLDAEQSRLYLLVLRCQAGDESAFAQLLEQFGPRTLAHLRGLIGDDAEDVQQEVWWTVYRRIGSLGNPRAFRTWLFQATIVAWSATFLIVLAFALLTGMQLVEMVRAVRQEGLPWTVVVGSAIPLIVVLGFLSVLIATLSTIAVFLRLRTSSLTEIQLRLAALEEMLASAPDSERSIG